MDDLFSFAANKPITDTSTDIGSKLDQLRAEVAKHDALYYDQAKTEISDADYDKLFRELEELEAKHPEFHDANSPTQRVGGKVLDSFKSIQHAVPMLSIDDYFSYDKIEEFFQRLQKAAGSETVDITIEPKIDGVAASILYRDGELVYCATRGDGQRGDDVTANARTIKTLPLKISNAPALLEVRGEIFMSFENFSQINKNREKEGKDLFANPRNATAGTLKLLDSKEVAKRPLSFLAHGIGAYEGNELSTEDDFRKLLEQLNIPHNTPVWHANSAEDMVKAIEELEVKRHDLGHATDGAVVKVKSFPQRRDLGATARAPRWAAAFKYPPEQKDTQLLDITIQVGRTGNLTPVAELKPVHVSGSTISRATLHNEDEIQRKDVRIGDTVVIEKAGEIIPSVVKVLLEKRPEHTQPFSLFEYLDGKCPACKGAIQRDEGFSAWKCINFTCPAQASNKITHFASRKALDLNGLGESLSIRLVETGMAKSILDLFQIELETLTDLELEPAKMQDGSVSKPRKFGPKRASSLIQSIESAKTEIPLSKWLYSLGIHLVGESASKEISRLVESIHHINDCKMFHDICSLAEAKQQRQLISPRNKTNPPKDESEKFERQNQYDHLSQQLKELEAELAPYQISSELGPATTQSLLRFFESPTGLTILETFKAQNINPLSDCFSPIPAQNDSLSLNGLTFVITGTLSKPRPDFKKQIEQLGGKVSGSVSKNTHYLLSGEGGGSKYTKAESLNVPILDEEAFNQLLGTLASE